MLVLFFLVKYTASDFSVQQLCHLLTRVSNISIVNYLLDNLHCYCLFKQSNHNLSYY